jgi:Ca-activated chloride channel family protein
VGIQFNETWLLILLLPLGGYVWWMWRTLHRLQRGRKIMSITLRSTVLILLILALAGPQWFTLQESKQVVFALDRSDSVEAASRTLSFIRKAAEQRGVKDEAAVISMGLDAALEKSLDSRTLDSFELTSPLNGQFSDLGAGLQLSSSLLHAEAGGRIVLISDGEENVGDVLRQGKLLKDRGIPVDILALPVKERKDAAIEAIRLPEKLFQAEQYTIEVVIRSTVQGKAVLRVYEDQQEMTEQQVELNKGENRYAIRTLAKEPGLHRYRAEIYMDGDEQAANNTDYAFNHVQGPPKVLIVEGQAGISQNVQSALLSALIPYELISPELLSNDFVTYSTYDSIILNNVPATDMPLKKMEMMEQAVRDYGVGLVMLGGEDSYGLGGYFKTPIERALPVYMDLRGKREIPSLGLVIVMDKSGSMQGEKMRLAQEAASRTVDLLRDKDTLGVLAFDSSPVWFVEPQKLSNKTDIMNKINSIPADGGTEIYSAVQQGYEKLTTVEAQRKHIILLTDGQSSTNESYEALTQLMQKDQITMSTVAIGADADQALLGKLAELAKGRFYAAIDETTIPAIFSREAVLISRTYVVNQSFTPAYTGGSDWSELFRSGIPMLNGYIATTAKETAESILISPEPDPIAARWQYGSGRSVAWTSDVNGKWSSEWVAWPGFPQALVQMIKWTFPQFQTVPMELTAHLNGNEARLEARSGGSEFMGELKAIITDEELQAQEVQFTSTVPGEYTANLTINKPGVYLAATELIVADNDTGAEGRSIGKLTTGFVIPYSPEYRITANKGEEKLHRLAELTGGRLLSLENPEDVFAYDPVPFRKLIPIHEYLLIAALLLLLLDIAVRRISLPRGAWTKLLKSWTRNQEQTVAATDSLIRLKHKKDTVSLKLNRSSPNSSTENSMLLGRQDKVSSFTDLQSPAVKNAVKTTSQEPAKGNSDLNSPDSAQPDSMSRLLAAKQRKRK